MKIPFPPRVGCYWVALASMAISSAAWSETSTAMARASAPALDALLTLPVVGSESRTAGPESTQIKPTVDSSVPLLATPSPASSSPVAETVPDLPLHASVAGNTSDSAPATSALPVAEPETATRSTAQLPAPPDDLVAPVSNNDVVGLGAALNNAPSAGLLRTGSNFDDLWERIRAGLRCPDLNNDLVRQHENWYASRPQYVARMLERSKLYLHHVVEEVEKRGMPLDIALLPMIESAYNPGAYSHSHASGIWQFIPSTGKSYGLEQTWWYDGRRDVLAATDAALNYLQYLHGLFGDWHLALAAYNWGEGAVARAITKNQAKGLPTDYESLNMPQETRNYVPKLMAIRHIIDNPRTYGLNLPQVANKPYFASVDATRHMDLDKAAQLAGMSVADFVNLNPAYNKPVVAYKESRKILVPVDRVERFMDQLSTADAPLLSWQPYVTRYGDKLEKLAQRYQISPEKLREVNQLQGVRRLSAGRILLVPLPAGTKVSETAVAAAAPETPRVETEQETEVVQLRPKLREHRVVRGETLASIARRYGVSAKALQQSNHLRRVALKPGQMLRLPVAVERDEQDEASVAAPTKTQARSSARTTKPLTALRTHAGHLSGKERPARHGSQEKPAQEKQYVIRRGDTLYSIAQRFNVSPSDLKRWNRSASRPLQPGGRMRIELARGG